MLHIHSRAVPLHHISPLEPGTAPSHPPPPPPPRAAAAYRVAHLHPELLPRLHVLAFGSPRWAGSEMHAHFKALFGQRALNLVTVGTAAAQPRTPLLSPPSTPLPYLPGWWVETREAKVLTAYT
jgi:hypothetical protein